MTLEIEDLDARIQSVLRRVAELKEIDPAEVTPEQERQIEESEMLAEELMSESRRLRAILAEHKANLDAFEVDDASIDAELAAARRIHRRLTTASRWISWLGNVEDPYQPRGAEGGR